MKIIKYLLTIFILITCASSYAQSTGKMKKIKFLKLKKEYVLKYFQNVTIQGFTVDKNGLLTPDDEYEMVISEDEKQFIVKPQGIEYSFSDNVEVQEIPGGSLMVCSCGFGAGDDCQIYNRKEGGDTSYKCIGNCECGSIYIDIVDNVDQYETADGR